MNGNSLPLNRMKTKTAERTADDLQNSSQMAGTSLVVTFIVIGVIVELSDISKRFSLSHK